MASFATLLSREMLARRENATAGGEEGSLSLLWLSSGGQLDDGEVLPLDMLEYVESVRDWELRRLRRERSTFSLRE